MRDRVNYLVAVAFVVLVVAIARAEPPRLFSVRNCMSGGCGQAPTTQFRVTNKVRSTSTVVATVPAPAVSATVTGDCAGGTCSVQQRTVSTGRFRLFR